MDPSRDSNKGKDKRMNANLSPACGMWLGRDNSGNDDGKASSPTLLTQRRRHFPDLSPACGNWLGSSTSAMDRTPAASEFAVPKKEGEKRLEDMPRDAKMLTHQFDLPHLPVPELEEACAKFLRFVKPLITPEQYRQTAFCVKEFTKRNGAGEVLWCRLKRRSEAEGVVNWLEQYWNAMYDTLRVPLVPYISPSYCLLPDRRPGVEGDPFVRCATLLHPMIVINERINKFDYPPDVIRGTPLCMWEYQFLFNRSRVPVENFDINVVYTKNTPFETQHAFVEHKQRDVKHVIVFYRHHAYYVETSHPDGRIFTLAELIASLRAIQNNTPTKNECAVQTLTSENRDIWAKARDLVMKHSKKNEQNLEDIESSIMYAAIDDEDVPEPPGQDATRYVLMGDPGNRWFDKGLGLFISRNGVAGFQFEHSAADAWPYICIGEQMTSSARKYDIEKELKEVPNQPVIPPRLLEFDIPETIPASIAEAEVKYTTLRSMLSIDGLELKNISKKIITRLNCSPDGFMQMAMQLAYYRLNGKPGSTYAAGGTKMFHHGRTETVRTVSEESVAFCKAVAANDKAGKKKNSLQKLHGLLKDACNRYTLTAIEAKTGKACDRLLFGLKCTASEMGIDTPALYRDEGYNEYLNIQLSTSNVPPVTDGVVQVFGPVNESSFGLCYAIYEDRVTVGITSFNPAMTKFVELFKQSIADLQEILKAGPSPMYALKEKTAPYTYVAGQAVKKAKKPLAVLGTVALAAAVVVGIQALRRRNQ